MLEPNRWWYLHKCASDCARHVWPIRHRG